MSIGHVSILFHMFPLRTRAGLRTFQHSTSNPIVKKEREVAEREDGRGDDALKKKGEQARKGKSRQEKSCVIKGY